MVEHNIDQQFQLIELLSQANVDVVKSIPVRLEGPLPHPEQDSVAEEQCTNCYKQENKERVSCVLVVGDDPGKESEEAGNVENNKEKEGRHVEGWVNPISDKVLHFFLQFLQKKAFS